MCGRYASFLPAVAIANIFGTINPLPNIAPTWNGADDGCAGGQAVPRRRPPPRCPKVGPPLRQSRHRAAVTRLCNLSLTLVEGTAAGAVWCTSGGCQFGSSQRCCSGQYIPELIMLRHGPVGTRQPRGRSGWTAQLTFRGERPTSTFSWLLACRGADALSGTGGRRR
jgi:hypothetical protein